MGRKQEENRESAEVGTWFIGLFDYYGFAFRVRAVQAVDRDIIIKYLVLLHFDVVGLAGCGQIAGCLVDCDTLLYRFAFSRHRAADKIFKACRTSFVITVIWRQESGC